MLELCAEGARRKMVGARELRLVKPPILVLYRISNSLDKSQSCTDSRLNAFYVPSTPSDPSGKRGGLLMSDVFSHAPHFIVPSEYHWRLRVNGAKRGEYEFWDVRDYGRTLPVTEFVTNNPEDQKVMESYFGSDNLSRGFINDADVGSDGAGGKGKRRGLMSKLKLSASSSSSSATHLPQVGQSTLLRVMSFNLLAVNPDLGPSLLSTPPKARFATRSAYVPPMRPVTNPATTARKTNKTFASSSVQRQKVDTPSLDHNVDLFNDTVSQPPTIARAEGSGGGAPSREESLKSFYNFQKTRQNRRWDEIEQRWVVTDDDVGKPACGQAGRKKSRSSETGAAAPRTLSNTKLAVESRLKRESETKSKQKEAVDNLRKRNEKAALEEKSTDLARIKLEESTITSAPAPARTTFFSIYFHVHPFHLHLRYSRFNILQDSSKLPLPVSRYICLVAGKDYEAPLLNILLFVVVIHEH